MPTADALTSKESSEQKTDMTHLAYLSFESGTFPDGWMEQTGACTFENHALRTNGGTMLSAILVGGTYRKARIEWEVEAISGAHLTYDDGTLAVIADLTNGLFRITYFGRSILASSDATIDLSKRRLAVTFEFDHGEVKITVEGRLILSARDPYPAPFARFIDLGIWDDCLVHSIRILGGDQLEMLPTVSPTAKAFHLEIAVDFLDDVIRAPWTHETFDQLFSQFRNWGIKRCHWLDYGTRQDGLWDYPGEIQEENLRQTLDNVGEIFPAAVRAAHRHGVEIYAVLKPFDLGYEVSFGESTELAHTAGRLDRIGGPVGRIARFPAEHREWIMARKPGIHGPAANAVFNRIDLVKNDVAVAGFSVEDICLYVSDDNTTYRLYEGPVSREEVVEDYPIWEHTSSGGRPTGEKSLARVLRLSHLCIPHKYIVLTVKGEQMSFANSLINLVHVFGERGEERRLTFGTTVRSQKGELNANVQFVAAASDFRLQGLEFDKVDGIPTACTPGYDAIKERFVLDDPGRVLGIARGKDVGPTAALSPAFPQVREWWLSWLRRCLEEGADGIELRVRNHHTPYAWAEFGFERPVRDEFLKRHNVDLWETDDFDKEAWRRLRGEGYTEFCREARRLALSFGKPMGLHISPTEGMEPEQGGAMEIHWDWRTWIAESLADSITFKEIWPESRLGSKIWPLAQTKGIAIIFSPYANDIWKNPGGEKIIESWIGMARNNGLDGYQFYENAAIVKATTDGGIIVEPPAIHRIFQNHLQEDKCLPIETPSDLV